jgi:hypothetical protein
MEEFYVQNIGGGSSFDPAAEDLVPGGPDAVSALE